jgi:hypothetical protein
MGGFINSQADNEICEALNIRFSDDVDPDDDKGLTYLEQLRDHFRTRENFLDRDHKLNRVFHRLAITVTGKRVPRDKRSRHRWLFLLRKRLPRDLPNVEQAIRNQLRAVLGPPSDDPAGAVSYVTFATRHVKTDTKTFELFPRNGPSPAVLQDANGKSYCTIILECHEDKPLEDSVNEPDPPPEDDAEKDFAGLTSHVPMATTESYSRRPTAKKREAAGKDAAVKKAKKRKSRR